MTQHARIQSRRSIPLLGDNGANGQILWKVGTVMADRRIGRFVMMIMESGSWTPGDGELVMAMASCDDREWQ